MTDPTRARLLIQLLDEIARMRGRLTSAFAEGRIASGLSDLEMVVLNAVFGAAQPPTVPQIGRSLGHARQVIQRAATTLVEKGLLDWVANPDHKRAHRLIVTDHGAALKAQADADGLAVAARLAEGMDAALLGRAVESLHAIRESIEAHARSRPVVDGDQSGRVMDDSHAVARIPPGLTAI
jgi:DNA-binding MarR family transcriptional regulator